MLLSALAVLTLAGCASKGTEPSVRNVLFVGNSYTYQHDVPILFSAEADQSVRYETKMFAGPGLNLMAYVGDDRIESLLDNKDWFAIVLQDRSAAAFYSKDRSEFKLALEWFQMEAEKEGARLILFQTWPRRADHSFYDTPAKTGFSPPRTPGEMLATVTAYYAEGAEITGAEIATVGECWMQHEDLRRLYAQDGSHASVHGAKLAARVIARTIEETNDPCA